MQALIHIGTHKTGTTSFQNWAAASGAPLAAAGVTWLDGRLGPSHAEVPMLTIDADRSLAMRAVHPDWCLPSWQAEAREDIRAQGETAGERLLISSEALSYARRPQEVERLAALFAPRRIHVVAVLREPRSYLRSYRRTLSGMGFEPSRHQGSFAYVEDDSWLLDYEGMLGAYREALGEEAVTVLDYEAELERRGSIIPAILDGFGIEPDGLPDWDDFRDNRSRRGIGLRRRLRVVASGR
jgi:hypothetical protein